ncbi:MAG: cytochrome c biogenesis CcdA family protein [Actinomycetota bacterium]
MGTGVVIALVAGGLATINPCGFALLPAFLSLQFVDDTPGRARVATIARGVQVGATVGLGFIMVFVVAGVPIALGASFITRYVAWIGALVGVLLIAAALWVLIGHPFGLSTQVNPGGASGRRGLLAFGISYGAASLGCTLPVFLAVVGVGVASRSTVEIAATFGAYAAGTLATLVVLAITASTAREWLAVRMKRLIPHMRTVSGVLLLVAGIYLSYYWIRIATIRSVEDVNADVVTRSVGAVAAATERFGAEYGQPLIALMLTAAVVAVTITIRGRAR